MKPTRPIYSNDRNAPRMKKASFITNIVTKELWEKFRKDFPEYQKMPYKEFFKRWEEIADTIRDEMITNPLGVKLGAYTGELKYQYTPNKIKRANTALSTELGEKVDYVNLNTKGKIGIIKWERRWAVKFNKMLQFFAFEGARKIHDIAKKHTDEHPELLRVARNTLGGHSIWRQLGK